MNISEKLNSLSPVALLTIRLTLGITFALTGYGKLMHLAQTTAYFESLHIPFAYLNAVVASSIEFLGGITLILGLLTRLASLGLISVMIIAILTAKVPELTQALDLIGFQEWDYILLLAILGIFGAGKWSIDRILFK